MSDNKIVNFSDKNKNVLTSSIEAINSVAPELLGEDGVTAIASLMSLPDKEFEILSSQLLFNLEKDLNNAEDRIILVQALNASGYKVEDLVNAFDEICKQIDEQMTTLSNPKKDFLKRMMGMLCNAISETEGIAKKIIQVPIQLCCDDAKLPQYANETDAGLDVYALEDITIHPGETKLIKTGLKVAIPVGYEIQVRPKSGRALKTKMRVANSPGTIDSGYRDEIGVIIDNIEPPIKNITYETILKNDGTVDHLEVTSIDYGADMFIGKGEKFAQLVLSEVPKIAWLEVDNIENVEGNRGGGFGSSGLK